MPLPAAAKKHHTVWVHAPGGRPRAARYAVDGDRIVCFGDGPLADIADGTRVTAVIHEIATGPPLTEFPALLQVVDAQNVERNALFELLDHVPLGRTAEEVEAAFEWHRSTRRLVALLP